MPTFKSLYTDYGLARLGESQLSNIKLNLTHMAVGDGNGFPTEPTSSDTQLVRERYRAAVNRVYPSPTDPSRWTAELLIPKSVAGFVVREAAVIDDQMGLCVIANLPDTYKPHESEGAFADTVIRVDFVAANAELITLLADPNVAVATHTWVLNAVTTALLIPGGTTRQVLTKKSNADGDTEWADPDTANVVVDVIEEHQLLALDQTTVAWSTVTTQGLAVYIDGLRIEQGPGADQWLPNDLDPDTSIELGQSYPAGTKILGTQNEPNGAVTVPLARDANLADVPDKPLARSNLGVHSAAESNAAGQPGDIKYSARTTAPTGWLKANGAAVSRTVYADLFAVIGERFGAGDGFNTFNLPDLRGEFVRGWDDGRGVDAGRLLGRWQADALREHEHLSPWAQEDTGVRLRGSSLYRGTVAGNGGEASGLRDVGSGSASNLNLSEIVLATTKTGAAETRPRNIALLALIKY